MISITICKQLTNDTTSKPQIIYDKLFLPTEPISDDAFKTHNMTKEKLKAKGAKAITRDDALEIMRIIYENRGYIMAGFNIEFDYRTLRNEFRQFKMIKLLNRSIKF